LLFISGNLQACLVIVRVFKSVTSGDHHDCLDWLAPGWQVSQPCVRGTESLICQQLLAAETDLNWQDVRGLSHGLRACSR
jgi:hypothetical protein